MDADRANAFLFKVFTDVAAAAGVACVAVGDRLGLFTAMRGAGALRPAALAGLAGIDERYALEWLRTMAVGGYVDYDAAAGTFTLPDEHASVLADTSDPKFLGGLVELAAATSRIVPVLADAFRTGAGVPFVDYGEDLVEGLARANGPTMRTLLARRWIPTSPTAAARLAEGTLVVEVGCGSGEALAALATAFPSCRFVGFDVDAASIASAAVTIDEAGVSDRVELRQVPATELAIEAEAGLVLTIDVVHDLDHPLEALQAIRGALRPDGVYLMAEPSATGDPVVDAHPIGLWYHAVSTLHCLPQNLAAGGPGLGAVWGEQAAADLATDAGFSSFRRLDIANPVTALYELLP